MELTGDAKRFAPRIYRITFPATSRWHDLIARVTEAASGPLTNLLIAAPLAAEVAAGSDRATTVAHRTAVELLIREFAPLVAEWNVDDANGQPVRPDEAGLRGADFQMVMAIFQAWREGRIATPDGDEDEEAGLADIPMTPVPVTPPG